MYGPGDPLSYGSGYGQPYTPMAPQNEQTQSAEIDVNYYKTNIAGNMSLGETTPSMQEWAAVQPGMLLVSQKATSNRRYLNKSTVPCIACATGLDTAKEVHYHFAGVARAESFQTGSGFVGPSISTQFTIFISGSKCTVLNTSKDSFSCGDYVAWTFDAASMTTSWRKGPRHIALKKATDQFDPNYVGSVLRGGRKGEWIDIHLKY